MSANDKAKTRELTKVEVDNLRVYKSHKIVHGTPMSRGEYNKYRGWDLPANEDGSDEGYLVIYNKDTVDHYESWTPKKQLDEGYTEV